eukprot:6461026-Amphidinium_carterae.2
MNDKVQLGQVWEEWSLRAEEYMLHARDISITAAWRGRGKGLWGTCHLHAQRSPRQSVPLVQSMATLPCNGSCLLANWAGIGHASGLAECCSGHKQG